ncbi:MAG TPA: GNAT family N-acetyltransferase [Tepidisphaeraceae bacterium]|jgi:hypothetical protein
MINALLLDVPGELTTQRLRLRTPRVGDGEIVWPNVRESLNELKRWMPWAKDEYSLSDAEEWCRKAAANFITREQLQFLIFLRDGGPHIGNIGIFKFNWNVPSCEIGYWLHTQRTGNGFMSEAVNALTAVAQEALKMTRIQICTDVTNERSWRVAQRCGYSLDGVLRNDSRAPDGALRSTRVYSKVISA